VADLEVRFFGLLHAHRDQCGLSGSAIVEVPEEGVVARDLARALDLPLDLIEGVFCNGKVCGPSHVLVPGDRVAFVPKGTPGPHRFALGLYSAGAKEPWDE
jgi:hypothetical protein